MFTKVADYLQDDICFPAGPDDGLPQDPAALDGILPLWAGTQGHPSLRFGDAILSSKSATACTGRWQLHVFSFAAEALLAQQTLLLVDPARQSEAGTRPTGEGLLLVREGDGSFECRIIDRRKVRGTAPLSGSWEVPAALARRAALHVPPHRSDRAEAAVRMLSAEFHDADDRDALRVHLCATETEPSPGGIAPQAVLTAANRLLEPLGMELSCSDRQVRVAIDAHLSALAAEMEALVERIAHDLVADLADSGCVG